MEVYRVGTLTRAAEGLYVTQQAVSRKIIMLEDDGGGKVVAYRWKP